MESMEPMEPMESMQSMGSVRAAAPEMRTTAGTPPSLKDPGAAFGKHCAGDAWADLKTRQRYN